MPTLDERRPEREPQPKVTNHVRELVGLPPEFLKVQLTIQKNRHNIQSDSLALAYAFLEAGKQTLKAISEKYDTSPHPSNAFLMYKISDDAKKEPDATKAEEIRNEAQSLREGYAAFAFGLVYLALDDLMDGNNQTGRSSRTDFAESYNRNITGTLLPKIDPQLSLPADTNAKLTEANEEQLSPFQMEKLRERLATAHSDLLVLLKTRNWKLLPTYLQSFLYRTGVDILARKDITAWFSELREKLTYADTSRRLIASVFDEQDEQPTVSAEHDQPGRRGQTTDSNSSKSLADLFGDWDPARDL